MNTELVIVGAGAAGIGAAKAAARLGVEHIVLEASHRIGGRAYTEYLGPGVPFDLGCHWLHSARENPLTRLLELYGMDARENWEWRSNVYRDGRWRDGSGARELELAAFDSASEMAAHGSDLPLYDVYDHDNEWAPLLDYWISLNHSVDPDQVSLCDACDYEETGEHQDWPVKQGYGSLIHRFGEDIRVRLNTVVKGIDYRGSGVTVSTAEGDIHAAAVLITVSTGILDAGDIRFAPALPAWKLDAISSLPLGNHNRICLAFDRDLFGDYGRDTATFFDDEDPPMNFSVRPFGFNYVVAVTGGRFADWLERAGQAASIDYATERLVSMFGSDAGRCISGSIVTAWRGDPWVRGAYSAVRPGAYGARALLAETIDDRVFFAGEATSPNFMDTAHGAYISGVREALRAAEVIRTEKQDGMDARSLAWELASVGA